MCFMLYTLYRIYGYWLTMVFIDHSKLRAFHNRKINLSDLKSLLLPRSQAEGWQMTSRPSVGLDSIDFSQKLSGKGSNPRLVKKSSAVRNIDVALKC